MSRKKILVCGSAGFLMSNFIRYLLYRTKEFEVVSVDKLVFPEDIKRTYIHGHHKFYIGNVCDDYFMDRVMFVEKPDFIIDGVGYHEQDEDIKGTRNLLSYDCRLIRLSKPEEFDHTGFRSFMNNTIKNKCGTVLELPNCFGLRQHPHFSIPKIIQHIIEERDGILYVDDEIVPWTYAEDVASFIWYIIEDKKFGKVVKMQPLGFASESEMAEIIYKTYDKPTSYKILKNSSFVKQYEGSKKWNWVSDYEDLNSALQKTIKWYNANRWALCI